MTYLLAIDQGTTSSRAILFNDKGEPCQRHQIPFEQHYPQNGWVEHNPEDIWQSTLDCCQTVIKQQNLSPNQIAGIGISNQRETTIIWHKETGKPIANAIVWQDRRTHEICEHLKSDKKTVALVQQKTGLLIDAYFCATKIAWLLDHIPNARKLAEQGKLAFGTVDSFLIWRLTGGKSHVTDATNASRTLLFDIHNQCWDQDLLKLFNIPSSLLPKVMDCVADFGTTDAKMFCGNIAITGVAGDQHAATIGQGCFDVGMMKSTYGTGCFVMLNTGKKPVVSTNALLSTTLYRLNGKVTYGLEGSIFNAGTVIKWLRDELGIIQSAAETDTLANSISDTNGVYFVPAFTGLGAPYWNAKARGAIIGLTRNSAKADIVRAALESVCYQTRDLLLTFLKDINIELKTLRVDGGMVANNWLLQFLANIVNLPIERPNCIETTALGAAFLSGLGSGVYQDINHMQQLWHSDHVFKPKMSEQARIKLYAGWQAAIGMLNHPC